MHRGRCAAVARIIFAVIVTVNVLMLILALVADPQALLAALRGPRGRVLWQVLQIPLAIMASLVAALVLLFTKDSGAWFAARAAARRQEHRPA